MSKLQPVRGTHDLIGEDAAKHRFIIDTARKIGGLYGFEEFSTPIFEFTEVFKRTLGETSDVVHKEMYSFEDRGGEGITLRPEFTAGIARAFISNGLQQNLPLKLFSSGPLFRYERPQKGRQRQFHQVNFEWLGDASPYTDVEMILMASHFLHEVGVLEKSKLLFNTLGDLETRQNYTKALVSYLKQFEDKLSEDSKKRLEINPLRILDSKDEGDKNIIINAPKITEYWSDSTKRHFDLIRNELECLTILQGRCKLEEKLVRGLDYYTHTIFEFVVEDDAIGAQNTVLAGGRYDGLIKQMGGPDTPAIGFAAGIERLALLSNAAIKQERPVLVISLDNAQMVVDGKGSLAALSVASMLRDTEPARPSIKTEIIHTNNLAKGLKKANKLNSAYVVIIGGDEISQRRLTVKNMDTGEQRVLGIDETKDFILGKK